MKYQVQLTPGQTIQLSEPQRWIQTKLVYIVSYPLLAYIKLNYRFTVSQKVATQAKPWIAIDDFRMLLYFPEF